MCVICSLAIFAIEVLWRPDSDRSKVDLGGLKNYTYQGMLVMPQIDGLFLNKRAYTDFANAEQAFLPLIISIKTFVQNS